MDVYISLISAQALRGRIGQAGQSIEVQRKVMLAQALHR
ncbi:MAG: hypothetical protein RLZZ436_2673 [Planctomycetota bacterium]